MRLRYHHYLDGALLPIFIIGLFFLAVGCGIVARAQEESAQVSVQENEQQVSDVEKRLQELRAQQTNLQAEIAQLQGELDQIKKQKSDIKKEISIIILKIKKLQLQLRETNLAIQELSFQIHESEKKIRITQERIDAEKEMLEEILQTMYVDDIDSIVELVLHETSFSEFLDRLNYLEEIQGALLAALSSIKGFKEMLQEETEILEHERQDYVRLKTIQENDTATLRKHDQMKKELLRSKESEEVALKNRLQESQKALLEIQRDLSLLVLKGTRVTTEEIIRLVQEMSIKTGIRAPFLLAVLEIESKLGANIGTGNWREDMKSNQHPAFLAITEKLGLNPDEVPVSKRVFSGGGTLLMWGGALGPAQFLPSTWLIFEDEISSLMLNHPPSPWNMSDAIAAMALYLKRYGGDSLSGERQAAQAYVSGRPHCSSFVCRGYARQVLEKAQQWEEYFASLLQ